MSGATCGIQNQKDFLIKKGFRKQISVIPFTLYEQPKCKEDLSDGNKILKVIIPGHVSELRRENIKFLTALEKLPQEQRNKLSINFLGSPGKFPKDKYSEILFKVLDLRNKGFNIILNDKFIHLKDYNKQLDEADIILGNINVKCGKEIYGESKDTGIHYTMISSAKPGLLPSKMKEVEELESSTRMFNDYKHVIDIISGFVQYRNHIRSAKEKTLLEYLKDQAKENSLKFTKEKVRDSLKNFVEKL